MTLNTISINTISINTISREIFKIGFHGPYILMIMSILMIIYEARLYFPVLGTALIPHLHFVSIVGNKILLVVAWNIMNIWINGLLKKLIKQPRPKKSIKINKQDEKYSRSYGMPSGHAQSAAANFVFIALLFRNEFLTTVAALQTLLTLYQRYSFRMHSAPQLLVGSILGSASGYALYQCYRLLFLTSPKSASAATAMATGEKTAPPPRPVATTAR